MEILESLDAIQDHITKLEAVKQAAIDFLTIAKKQNTNITFVSNEKLTLVTNEEMVLSLTNLHDLAFELQN